MNPFVQSLLLSDQTTGSDSSGDLGETIDQSLRFRSSQNTNLTRTPGSAGNRRTWTYSFWYKPGIRTRAMGETQANSVIFLSVNKAANNSEMAELVLESDRLTFQGNTVSWFILNPRFRDPTAWYHYVLVCDTTNATAADRIRIYINGERITDFDSSSNPGDSDQLAINLNHEHAIGKRQNTASTNPLDGLMAEINFLDGTAIGDTNGVINEFGRYNEFGVWVPKTVGDLTSDQYGQNGYRLKLNSGEGAGVGDDSAPTGGNHASGNDWTLNNFDSGEVRVYSPFLKGSAAGSYESNVANRTTALINRSQGFNGDLSNQVQVNGSAAWIYWTTNISCSTVTLIVNNDSDQTPDAIFINGSSVSVPSATLVGSNFETTVSVSGGTLTEFAFKNQGGPNTSIFGMRVDGGSVLVDNYDNDIDYQDTPTKNYANYLSIINNDRPSFESAYLDATAINNGIVWATQKLPNKHLYAEFVRDGDGDRFAAGIANANSGFERGAASDADYAFMIAYSELNGNNSIFNQNTTATQNSLTDYITGDVLGVEWRGDLATRQVNFYINGTQVGNSENVAAGDDYYFAVQRAGGSNPPEVLANFGQMPYLAAPAGVTNTANGMQVNNMTTPTIRKGNQHFGILNYSAPPSPSFPITIDGSGGNNGTGELDFGQSPDLVWIKMTNGSENHIVFDTIRGVANSLRPDEDVAENTTRTNFAFAENGFTFSSAQSEVYQQNDSYIAWCWKAGGSTTTTNDTGTIDSEVSANTDAGFSIITWTGTGSDGSYGHGLTSPPEFILHKRRNGTSDWHCYHEAIGGSPANDVLVLNTDAVANTGNDNVFRQNPSSSVIFTGDANSHNVLNATYVDYAWHSVPGFSKFGGYTGNDNNDGIYIETGFKPALIIIKGRGQGWSWYMWDHLRNTSNPSTQVLKADLAQSQSDASSTLVSIDFLANGFKLRNAGGQNQATTYVYCAWAQNPFGGDDTPPMTAR